MKKGSKIIAPEGVVDQQEAPKKYWAADLMLKCHCCGNEEMLSPDIKGGVSVSLLPADGSNSLKLACNRCKAVIELYLRELQDTGLMNQDSIPIIKPAENKENDADAISEESAEKATV